MKLNHSVKLCLTFILIYFFSSTGFCASSYDRELIVQDKTRAMQVESVFKEMMAAYEDEDARGFLDYVSDERFRQDYITFTDALYSDFRNYEIHRVDYWIDRIVPDNVKQFLYVKWEKRYENLDDGRQLTQNGFSRFLFDEVDGEYLLVELAGNHLFGGSLQEWTEEVPQISGQEVTVSQSTSATTPVGKPDLTVVAYDYDIFTGGVSFRVNNIGTAASGSCRLDYIDTSTSLPPSIPYVIVPSIAAGESYQNTITPGPNPGRLTIDSGNDVNESNEANNVSNYSF